MDMKFILTVFPMFIAAVAIIFTVSLRVFLRRRAVHKQKKLDEQQRMQEQRIFELERAVLQSPETSEEDTDAVASPVVVAGADLRRRGLLEFDPRTYMPALISLLILAGALFVVLSQQYAADEQKWAFGSIGTILGFWLKP